MTYVITGDCCSDASCVAVCPMNSIHPSPGEGGFGATDGLFVDPRTCIDCGACADVCPVDAAKPAERATPVEVELNRAYFAEQPALDALDLDTWDPPVFSPPVVSPQTGVPQSGVLQTGGPRTVGPQSGVLRTGGTRSGVQRTDEARSGGLRTGRLRMGGARSSGPRSGGPRRVAVVGAGPAGMYATRELLLRSTAEMTVYDRLPVVGGLARFGVAPDHPMTKQIVETFARILEHPRVHWRPGTEAVTAELESRYDAVVHAVGSYRSRRLGIPGEDDARSCSAADMVAWYNGRPGVTELPVKLAGPRAVIIGNGNVALDLARLLVSDADRLSGLGLPPAVRTTLAASGITEVVIIGRRGPEAAAYSASGLRDLLTLDGVEVVVVDDRTLARVEGDGSLAGVGRRAVELAASPEAGRRIVLAFNTTPTGWDPVAGLDTDGGFISAGTLFTAIGFVGQAIPGLPFDERLGVVPNERGAVVGRPGHFVTGWIKRGAKGGIGANKACAVETVGSLLAAAPSAVLSAARM